MPRRKQAKKKPRLKSPVCKPCWELKYCPYGPLVEYFPIGGPSPFGGDRLTEIRQAYRAVVRDVKNGKYKTETDMDEVAERLNYLYPPRWEYLEQFDVEELQCNVFGHVCPVFFTWEAATETKTGRNHSRRIPRDVMLKVVRRDQSICQICFQPVPDNEVQFDHVIPHSRGGPLTPDCLRLVHARCNKRKSDSLTELLEERPQPQP